MWVQAWLNDPESQRKRWVDLDPTLPGGTFDAAHIAISVSSMTDDGMFNDLVQLTPMLGRLTIEVLQAD
jgi:hypothetical protein